MGAPGALIKPAVAAAGQALVRQQDGSWVPEYVAKQQDLDDVREELDQHHHDDRYYPRDRDTGWLAPTFSAGWSDYAAPYGPVRYRRTADGMVTIKGLASKTAGSTATAFVLPAGFRPATNDLIFAQMSDVGGGTIATRIDVQPNGTVYNPLANTAVAWPWISFSLSFQADQ